MGRKMDRLNECGPFQIRSSVVKNGSLPGRWLAGTCPPSCRPWRPESARWSAATSDSGTDPAHFLSPFQSCCRSRRCPVRPKACWRRENSSGQSKGFYGTFGKVVAQLQPSVLQYTDQIRALFLQIVYGFAQRRFWRSVGCFCPCQQSVHHGLGPFQTLRISFFGWQFC